MLTEIFKILVEDKLHFHVEVLDDDSQEEVQGNKTLLKKMTGMDPRLEEMVRLDKLMPMSQSVDLMDQMEVGHLGPAIRSDIIFTVCIGSMLE